MNIHAKAGVNRAAAQRRQRQTSPRSLIDGAAQKKNAASYIGAQLKQVGSAVKNTKNFDQIVSTPRSIVEAGYSFSYN